MRRASCTAIASYTCRRYTEKRARACYNTPALRGSAVRTGSEHNGTSLRMRLFATHSMVACRACANKHIRWCRSCQNATISSSVLVLLAKEAKLYSLGPTKSVLSLAHFLQGLSSLSSSLVALSTPPGSHGLTWLLNPPQLLRSVVSQVKASG